LEIGRSHALPSPEGRSGQVDPSLKTTGSDVVELVAFQCQHIGTVPPLCVGGVDRSVIKNISLLNGTFSRSVHKIRPINLVHKLRVRTAVHGIPIPIGTVYAPHQP